MYGREEARKEVGCEERGVGMFYIREVRKVRKAEAMVGQK
jgi:hypothetical protein